MEPTFFAQYKGFEFHCSPTRLLGGGFIPRLLISADYGAHEFDIPVPVQGPPYLDATEAAPPADFGTLAHMPAADPS